MYDCKVCENGYIVKEGKCVIPETIVENCILYELDDPTICSACKKEYKLEPLEKKSCILIRKKESCLIHNYYRCAQCKSGYQKNPNLYFEILFKF